MSIIEREREREREREMFYHILIQFYVLILYIIMYSVYLKASE